MSGSNKLDLRAPTTNLFKFPKNIFLVVLRRLENILFIIFCDVMLDNHFEKGVPPGKNGTQSCKVAHCEIYHKTSGNTFDFNSRAITHRSSLCRHSSVSACLVQSYIFRAFFTFSPVTSRISRFFSTNGRWKPVAEVKVSLDGSKTHCPQFILKINGFSQEKNPYFSPFSCNLYIEKRSRPCSGAAIKTMVVGV